MGQVTIRRRDHQDGDAASVRLRREIMEHAKPADARQAQIQNHEIGQVFIDALECRQAVSCLTNLIAGQAQGGRDEVTKVLIIINDKNRGRRWLRRQAPYGIAVCAFIKPPTVDEFGPPPRRRRCTGGRRQQGLVGESSALCSAFQIRSRLSPRKDPSRRTRNAQTPPHSPQINRSLASESCAQNSMRP